MGDRGWLHWCSLRNSDDAGVVLYCRAAMQRLVDGMNWPCEAGGGIREGRVLELWIYGAKRMGLWNDESQSVSDFLLSSSQHSNLSLAPASSSLLIPPHPHPPRPFSLL